MFKQRTPGRWRVAIGLLICLSTLARAVGPDNPHVDYMRDNLRTAGGLTEAQAEDYLAEMYGPQPTPSGVPWFGWDAFDFDVPEGLGNRELAELGLVDVTAAPFNADPTGQGDATAALQAAVDFARDHQMVCFFPPGTYLISDTLECRQLITMLPEWGPANAQNYPCALIGSTRGERPPRLVLARQSPGFTNPDHRKVAVHFLNDNVSREVKPDKGARHPQTNISYSQIFKGIDIVIGEGNRGAIGIRMQAAEGSTIQDVTIDATHGDTGMLGAAGSGGSHHNITVIGGRIGIDTRGWPPTGTDQGPGTQPGPTMTGITLRGQTETPFYNDSSGPLTGIGWHITTAVDGPAIVARDRPDRPYYYAILNLVDSVIEFTSSGRNQRVIEATRGAYLRDVYVRGAREIAAGQALGEGWSRIEEAVVPAGPTRLVGQYGTYDVEQPVFLEGVRVDAPAPKVTAGAVPPPDLQSRHLWAEDFPSWESPDAANVKRLYGAVGDGVADDTAALQQAIDENEIVLLPKGIYRVTDTLCLRAETKLVGVWHAFSKLIAYPPFGALAEGPGPKPLVDTVDDADADTVISFLGINVVDEVTPALAAEVDNVVPCYALRWRCGRRSVVRSPKIERPRYYAPFTLGLSPDELPRELAWRHPFVLITGHGGGKWYNFFMHGNGNDDEWDYCHVLVKETAEPLAFYHFHAQHAQGHAQLEVRDSANVDIFGFKCETEGHAFLGLRSRNIRLYGTAGWASSIPGTALYSFVDCEDFLVAGYGGFIRDRLGRRIHKRKHMSTPFTQYFPIGDQQDGSWRYVSPFERPLLYRRGEP